jgi:hypothetical protein
VVWDDSEVAIDSLLDRAAAMKANAVVARENLEAAQHRDTLRYAQVRSGAYRPKIHEFKKGDYVYLHRANMTNTLQIKAMQAAVVATLLRMQPDALHVICLMWTPLWI